MGLEEWTKNYVRVLREEKVRSVCNMSSTFLSPFYVLLRPEGLNILLLFLLSLLIY